MNENFKNDISKEIMKIKHILTVISKDVFGEYNIHDIQSNSSWSKNPYGEDYAVVPDDLVGSIMKTRGFCDIVLNEEGTEVVSFTPLEIPDIPEPEPQTPVEERVTFLEEVCTELMYQNALSSLGITEADL